MCTTLRLNSVKKFIVLTWHLQNTQSMGPKGPIIGCQEDPWLYVTPAALQSAEENTKKYIL